MRYVLTTAIYLFIVNIVHGVVIIIIIITAFV